MPITTKSRTGWQHIWAWISIGALALGSFGPWVKGPFGTSVSGLDGSNDGWLTLGAAVVAAILLARIQVAPGRRVVGRAFLLFLVAGIAAFTAIHDRSNVSDSKLLQVGWGLNLTLVAGISLALAAIAVQSRPRASEPVSTTLEDAPS